MSYVLIYTKQARKDAKKMKGSPLAEKIKELLRLIEKDPFCSPPPLEKLNGDLNGYHSRRINVQHRIVYEVFKKEKVVHVLRLWTHYE